MTSNSSFVAIAPTVQSSPAPSPIFSSIATSNVGSESSRKSETTNGVTITSISAQPTPGRNATQSVGPSGVPSPDKGVSGGAVAGIAIGMLLVGALIAGALFFFLLRRQKRRQLATATYQTHQPPHNGMLGSAEKGPAVVAGAVASNIDDFLPQPVADDTITDEVSKIRDNIKNHVRTYYHSTPIPAGVVNEAGLRDLAIATGVSPSVLGAALSNPSSRHDTLRLVVGWIILSRCTGERDTTLLPAEVSRLASAIPSKDGGNSTQSALYSKWKVTTGALLQQRFGKNVQDPSRAQAIANTTSELDSILLPFVQGGVDDGQRRKNLDMILSRSANFAFLLFSQPGSFRFDFASRQGRLVAFPAFIQINGDQGHVLRPSRVLIEQEAVA